MKKPKWYVKMLKLSVFTFVVFYLALSIVGAEFYTRSVNRTLANITPADYSLTYQDVSFPALEDNLTIRGWFVPNPSKQAIVAVHGKGGTRLDMLDKATQLAGNGFNLLMIDLRGHGVSDGSNFSYGMFEQRDVLGAIEYLKRQGFASNNIGIWGESMGAATGLLAMGRNHDIGAMVSDSAYADLNRQLESGFKIVISNRMPAASIFYPGMLVSANLLHGIDTNKVRPEEAVANLQNQSLLLIHGTKDGLVPLEHAYNLKAAAKDKAELWVIPNADHVGAYPSQPAEFTERITTFFKQHLR